MSPLEGGAWMILEEAYKGLLVLAVAGLAVVASRSRPAARRHQVWALALLTLLALPILSALVPSWAPIGIPAWNKQISSTEAQPWSGEAPDLEFAPPAMPAKAQSAEIGPQSPQAPSSRAPSDLRWLALFWLIGFVLASLRFFWQGVELRRLLRSGTRWQGPDVLRLLEEQRRALGIGKTVQVRLSADAPVPMAFGLRHNCILLPVEAQEWSPQRLRVVLLHECAHLARRDSFFNLAGELAGLLHWFNPLVWLALRRMRLESEKACDDLVLGCGIQPRLYAQFLLDCVRQLRAGASWSIIPAAMADRSGLKRRLQSILDQRTPRQGQIRRAGWIGFCLAALLLVPLASLRLRGSEEASAADHPQKETPDSLQQMIAALDDSEAQVRKRAAWSLGEREDRRAVERLIRALQDPDPEVRAMASWALGEIKDRRALQPLQAALKDSDVRDREMAAMALGELEDRRAVPALTGLLDDPAMDVRSAAVWALGEIGGQQAWQHVIEALADSGAAVRLQAAEVLGRRQVREALPSLLKSLADPEPPVRAQAAHSLGWLRSSEALPGLLGSLVDPASSVRRESATALGRIGDPQSVDALIRTLRDQEAQVRAQAVWALDEISDR